MRPCRAERRPAGGFVSSSVSVSTSRVWMWSLTLGCIAGSVWSSSSSARYNGDSVAPAGRPVASTSHAYPERDSHVLHSAPVSIYRTSASLRSWHGESLTPNLLTRGCSSITYQLRYAEFLNSPSLYMSSWVFIYLFIYFFIHLFNYIYLLLTSFSQSYKHTRAIERTLVMPSQLHSLPCCDVFPSSLWMSMVGNTWKHAV